MSNRSKNFVFIPFCVLSQAFHAEGLVRYEWGGIIKPIVQLLMDYDVNMIQMPCMETIHAGLDRKPQGIKQYDTPDFNLACHSRALEVVGQMKEIQTTGYKTLALLGMEYSPSCAVKLQYPPKKGDEGRGIFMKKIVELMETEKIDVPLLGINRRGIGPTLKRLEAILKRGCGE